jgi:hypothetical protein
MSHAGKISAAQLSEVKRGSVDITDDELKDMADALWRIRDLCEAGRVILGYAPEMVAIEGKPPHDGLWGILASIKRLTDSVSDPLDRQL